MFPGQPSHRISIHAPREGGDVKMPTIPKGILRFQSTPPARGATWRTTSRFRCPRHFNPRPPRGGRPHRAPEHPAHHGISIHAPREGGDDELGDLITNREISIHAPREGGDIVAEVEKTIKEDFNPRPPRGGRPTYGTFFPRIIVISIHAPREGGDSKDAQFYL